jgi:hypothetical protein
MPAKSRRAVKRHRLLVYHRLGQRLRTLPFLIVLASAVLFALAWMRHQNILDCCNQELLARMWDNRLMLYLMIGASVLLYLFSLAISWTSFVEARPKVLHVRAGLIPVNISYGRIQQIRLGSLGLHHPAENQKGGDRAIVEEFEGLTCTVIDLKSLPKPFTRKGLQRVWHKFMFTNNGSSLLFVVKDAMVLNQQIDAYISARMARQKGQGRYLDPVERAAQMQMQRARQSAKPPVSRRR